MGNTVEELNPDGLELDEANVREAFNAFVAADGRPLSQIAPETGIHYTTLSSWKARTYTGNNGRITALAHQFLVTREARKRTHAAVPKEPGYVPTPTASAILDVLEAAQVLPDMAVISGASGIGKTTAIEWYQRKASNVWVVTMEPAFQSLGCILNEIAVVLGTHTSRSASFMSGQIRRRMANSGGLLIIDEAQHLSPTAVDQLRSFYDRARVGIAMVGNETIARRYSNDRLTEQYAPLFSRVGQKLRQKRLKSRDIDMLIEAWGLTDEGARKVARTIAGTPGAARVMTKALKMAFLLANARGQEQPNQQDVEGAWEQLGGHQQGGAA